MWESRISWLHALSSGVRTLESSTKGLRDAHAYQVQLETRSQNTFPMHGDILFILRLATSRSWQVFGYRKIGANKFQGWPRLFVCVEIEGVGLNQKQSCDPSKDIL